MTTLRIVPVVEGHGEVQAIRILLERVLRELFHHAGVHILQPIRQPRGKLLLNDPGAGALSRALALARRKLSDPPVEDAVGLALVLLDADEHCPAELGPDLKARLDASSPGIDVCCVIANVEYETWFVAAAESLREHLTLGGGDEIPADPEGSRSGKRWIEERFRSPRYSETVDQPRLTARMDLRLARSRSPSFAKLCRELERRLPRR